MRLSTWDKERGMIIIRQDERRRPKAMGKQPLLFSEIEDYRDYRYTVLVTNEKELSGDGIWGVYRPRANEENVIKELKGGYGLHEFNVKSFWGTEAVMLLIGMVCYNIIQYLNRRVLRSREESIVRLKRLQMQMLAIPAIYGSGGRRFVLRLGVISRKMRNKISYWLHRINDLKLRLIKCNAVCVFGNVEC